MKKLNNFEHSVDAILHKRSSFIYNFSPDKDKLYDNLSSSVNDSELNSIRVHKYLTETKLVGKVETARYLDKIGLNEKTTIKELTGKDISGLIDFLDIK